MIISPSIFKNSISLPNVNEMNVYKGAKNSLQNAIDEYGDDCLYKSLGDELYKDFKSALDTTVNPWVINTADQTDRFYRLLKGFEYPYKGETKVWRGLVFEKGGVKSSLVADYVYHKYIEELASTTTSTGEKEIKSRSAVNVGISQKQTNAFNRFLKRTVAIPDFRPSIIRTSFGVGIDYYGSRHSEVSLYEYLSDNKDLYPEWKPYDFGGYQNSFGL